MKRQKRHGVAPVFINLSKRCYSAGVSRRRIAEALLTAPPCCVIHVKWRGAHEYIPVRDGCAPWVPDEDRLPVAAGCSTASVAARVALGAPFPTFWWNERPTWARSAHEARDYAAVLAALVDADDLREGFTWTTRSEPPISRR